VPWSYTLAAGQYTNLSLGERVGIQICTNVTNTQTTSAYIQWEDNTLSSVQIPIAMWDAVAPTINFTAPTDASGAIARRSSIPANVTANDALIGLKNITIYLYNSSGSLKNSSTTNTTPNYINFTGLADGLYYINATAWDKADNMNATETRNITLDTTSPTITINAPTNTTYNNRTQLVNMTTADLHLSITT
jgi:hypothetical protein